jgi:hypothetical protein
MIWMNCKCTCLSGSIRGEGSHSCTMIWGLCTCSYWALGLLKLDCVEEVVMHCPWTLCTLVLSAPPLGQMRNLCELPISQFCVSENISPEQHQDLVATFTSQLGKLTDHESSV